MFQGLLRKSALRVAVLLSAVASSAVPAEDVRPQVPSIEISAHALKAHLEFLASDLLEGREAGSRGYDVAAQYVASQYRALGLVPAGDDGTFFQQVPMRAAALSEPGVRFEITGPSGPDGERIIYNGALDNAIGVAAMIDVARALATAEVPPRRSILFLAVTAEESGIIGSDYFVHHPTLDSDRIVANVNLDGMVPFYEFVDIIAFGGARSTLGDAVAAGAASMGLGVSPDPFPEQGIFTRSDHYAFVRQGIPAIFLYTGFEAGPDGVSGREIWDWALTTHYHQPTDDLNLPIDYGIAARFTQLYLDVVRRIVNGAQTPRWHDGDYFADRFAAGKRVPIVR